MELEDAQHALLWTSICTCKSFQYIVEVFAEGNETSQILRIEGQWMVKDGWGLASRAAYSATTADASDVIPAAV